MNEKMVEFNAGDLYFHNRIKKKVIICKNKCIEVWRTVLTTGVNDKGQTKSVKRRSLVGYMDNLEK